MWSPDRLDEHIRVRARRVARRLVLEPAAARNAGSGHRSVSMDLPVDDANATFADYADVVLASYPAAVEDAVPVGHSLGAMVIPLVAASRPASRLVFLCGLIPNVAHRRFGWVSRPAAKIIRSR